MLQKIFLKSTACFIAIILMIGFLNINSNATKTDDESNGMKFDCKSALLMEAETGKILFEQNADEALHPASVTKIMTLLLVMEAIDSRKINYNDMVTASAHACSMGGSQIYLKEGEQMSVEDLLKSVIIASANDAAVALAEYHPEGPCRRKDGHRHSAQGRFTAVGRGSCRRIWSHEAQRPYRFRDFGKTG